MARISATGVRLTLPMGAVRSRRTGQNSRYTGASGRMFIRVLDDVSFDAVEGDRIGIIGQNGSGKSSLLRVVAGIYWPDQGFVKLDGRPQCLFSVNMGMNPELSGRENIYLRGLLAGKGYRELTSLLDGIIAFAELEQFIDLPLRTYSAGMSARLAFSIATSFSPEILLLDEWIGAGDVKFQKKAAERMHQLVQHSAITMLASHNRTLVRSFCNKIIWLNEGKVVAFGPTDRIFRSHDSNS